MSYSEVRVITDRGTYQAQVDLEASDESILEGLKTRIGLPRRDKKGREIKYRMDTVGATRLRPGGTVRISSLEPPAVGKVRRVE
jgi:hypothetical protein